MAHPATSAPVQSLELKLLLACARSAAKFDPDPELPALLSQELNWKNVFQLAEDHGLLPILAQQLQPDSGAMPAEVYDRLQVSARQNVRRNLLFSAELLRIAHAFSASGIEFLPHKGVVLNEYLYGSASLRRVTDIDLIVRPEDRIKATGCLEKLGYRSALQLKPHLERAAMRHTHEWLYVRDGLQVDLHWQLIDRASWPSFNIETAWNVLVPMRWQSLELSMLPPELLLVTLGLHAAEHEWNQLQMFTDIAALVKRNPRLNWNDVEQFVSDSHAKRSLYVSLWLTHLHFQQPFPEWILQRIKGDIQVMRIAEIIAMQSWPVPETNVANGLRWLLFRTKRERLIDRWRYILSMLLLPKIADFQNYEASPSFLWIYFLSRPLRLILRRLSLSFQHPRGEKDSGRNPRIGLE